MGKQQAKLVDFRQQIAVLGGGQLGRMLIQESLKYPIDWQVLDPDPDAPCKDLVKRFECGSLMDFDTVFAFGQSCDIITIEIEHVNTDALAALKEAGKTVIPDPDTLRIIQDKGLQKQFYTDNGIPTADFILTENLAAVEAESGFLPAFQKLRKFGYDGKGVQSLPDTSVLDRAFTEPSLLEKAVDIEKEISVIVCRNASGKVAVFEPVELVFDPELNLVDHLLAPAELRQGQIDRARYLGLRVAGALKGPGIFAIEMFLDKEGRILVNETAPRTHNSGHHTIEACETSQFEQHLRVLLNLPPGRTRHRSMGAMVNLLGSPGHTGEAVYEGLEEVMAMEGVYVHLYGKKITKPGRKMGHVTIIGDDRAEIMPRIRAVKQTLKIIT